MWILIAYVLVTGTQYKMEPIASFRTEAACLQVKARLLESIQKTDFPVKHLACVIDA